MKKITYLIIGILLLFSVGAFWADTNYWVEDVTFLAQNSTYYNEFVNISGDTMTGDLDMGNNDINTIQSLNFNLTANLSDHEEGRIHWDDDDKTAVIDMNVQNVHLQIGQEQFLYATNKLGFQINNGELVYVNGAQGQRPTVALARADTESTSSKTLAMATHNCSDSSNCYFTTYGYVRELDTSAYSAGDSLYLSTSEAGNFTNVEPMAPNHTVWIGKVLSSNANEGIILLSIQNGYEISELHDVDNATNFDGNILSWNANTNRYELSHNATVEKDLTVNGKIIMDSLILDNLSSNDNINGDVFGMLMTGPSGQELPHLLIQPGGGTQASYIMRSLMIVDEIAGFHNTTDRTDCGLYMDNISETLQIDCNTTTSGADLLISDDMQVIGDVWLKDSEGEWHFMTRELDEIDTLNKNVIQAEADVSIEGTQFNYTTTINGGTGEQIVVNLDKNVSFLTNTSTVTLTTGTNSSPMRNIISYQGKGNPVLTNDVIEPTIDVTHASVWKGVIGEEGNFYSYIDDETTNDRFIFNVYHRFEDQRPVYVSGFETAADANEINFTTGTYWSILDQVTSTNNVSFIADGYFFVFSNGTFEQATDNSNFVEYNDGGTIAGAAYFNVIWGVVQDGDATVRLVGVPQNTPTITYVTSAAAEEDADGTITFDVADSEVNKHFLPIARTIVRNSNDEFQAFDSGAFFKSVIGVAEAGAAAGGTNDHGLLAGLADDDHTQYFLADGTRDITGSTTLTTGKFILPTGGTAGDPTLNFGTLQRSGVYQVNPDELSFSTEGKNVMHLDNSQNVGIGTTGPGYRLHIAKANSVAEMGIYTYNADAIGSDINFIKSRGSEGSESIVADDDSLGILKWRGFESAPAFSIAAQIEAFVDGTPGSGDMPGRLVFSTTPDGSATPLARLIIDNAGVVNVSEDLMVDTNTLYVNAGTNKVGIGTASPSEELEVESIHPKIKLQDSDTAGGGAAAEIEFFDSAGSEIGFVGDNSVTESDIFLRALDNDLHLGDSTNAYILTIADGVINAERVIQYNQGMNGTGNVLHYGGSQIWYNSSGGTIFGADTSKEEIYIDGNLLPLGEFTNNLGAVASKFDNLYIDNIDADTITVQDAVSGGLVATFINDIPTAGQSFGAYIGAGTNENDYALRIEDNKSEDIFMIRGNGRVGIGELTPTAMLDVVAEDGEGDNIVALEVKNQEATTDRNFGMFLSGGSSSVDYAMRVRDVSGSALMNIRGDGNVGIGTEAPSYALEVSGGDAVRSQVTSTSRAYLAAKGGTNKQSATLWENDGVGFMAGHDINNNGGHDFFVYDRESATTRLAIASGGELTVQNLAGTYGSGSAYVCVYDNGTMFASDSACP